MPNSDDTVILPRSGARPQRRRMPALGWACAALGVAVVAGVAVWLVMRSEVSPTIAGSIATSAPANQPPTVLAEPIPLATEAAIEGESPATRTVLRFAANPAIVVLDFPTLAEQGRMLNRLAAWAEKAGVPHDRLLGDAALATAIANSGATPDTYYYGHDYRGADVARFFALADRDQVALHPEEQELRRLMGRAAAEPAGFGALISLPRADPANDTTPQTRHTILHHELSHGEYFTNPAYAASVDAIWRSVMTEAERASFRTYLASEGYDPALDDLMENEMQAYLMHTPDPAFFDPRKLGIRAPRLEQIRASFLAGMPPGWLRDATPVRFPRRRFTRRLFTRQLGRVRPAGGRERQWPGRVSRTIAVAATVPPRRRRASMAA